LLISVSRRNGGEIKDILVRLDHAHIAQESVLEKAHMVAFFGQQVSRDMVDLMTTLEEEMETGAPLSKHVQRLIAKMTETVDEMEDKSADCAAQFALVVEELKEVSQYISHSG
jgi:hypothetical protein